MAWWEFYLLFGLIVLLYEAWLDQEQFTFGLLVLALIPFVWPFYLFWLMSRTYKKK